MAFIKSPTRQPLWLKRFIAILAVLNLFLVFFDISYLPWRDIYFQYVPIITHLYDPVKGIEPHRVTQNYLDEVDKLEEQIRESGLQSVQVETSLEKLRKLSDELISNNPFAIANKSGTLERIKNRIRSRVGAPSSRQAFDIFWSQAYLAQFDGQQELKFFNTKIRPFMELNYYRHIDINSRPVDLFGFIDFPFALFFCLEFLAHTFQIRRKYPDCTLQTAMLKRWYDIFLFLPLWRWLRVIPVAIRLDEAKLWDLEPLQEEISKTIVASTAKELTEVIGVRFITQAQELVKKGEITRWFSDFEGRRPYIDLNNTNEVEAISIRLLHLAVYQVLPKVQPDIETLIRYSVETMLKQSSAYQQLQKVPGLNQLPNQLTERLVTEMSGTSYRTLTSLLEDPVATKHFNRLIQNITQVLKEELKNQHNFYEIQSLFVDMLEEIKINYVKSLEEEEVEKLLNEAERLQQIVQPTGDRII